jgi:hypothetical protein
MMEVYEVMLFAFPLWIGLMVTLFLMVFGRDIVAYLNKCGQNPVARVKPSIRTTRVAEPTFHYKETAPRKGERELVLH